MRLTCLILVGIAALGCKDKTTPPGPAPARARPTPEAPATSGGSGATAQRAPEAPTLETGASFDDETRDAAWAGSAEQSIHAVAPQLTDVTCKRMQCRATLTAANEHDMMAAVDNLQANDALPSIDGMTAIKLTQPEPQNGSLVMTLYVRFDRE
jgi:hypothetical protein